MTNTAPKGIIGPLTIAIAALLMPAALAGCAPYPPANERRSLTAHDRADVPGRFHGLWANRLENCGAVGDRGMQVAISARRIGTANVIKVEIARDHPGVMIITDHPDSGQDRVLLHLSADGQWLELSFGHHAGFGARSAAEAADRFQRCPQQSGGEVPVPHTSYTGGQASSYHANFIPFPANVAGPAQRHSSQR